MSELYIGLMSGTSADGIDATLVEFSNAGSIKLIGHYGAVFPDDLRHEILDLCQPGDNEIERLGQLDHRLAIAFASAANGLLEKLNVAATQITAIGSHGQTVRHHPPKSLEYPFTLQVGDPNIIAEMTAITTVADFRRRDMAAGGEGAPLVPAFHRAAFSDPSEKRIIINIGGMANVTDLTTESSQLGFDTGPGNTLMDAWIGRHKQQEYDSDGQWAASGKPNQALVEQLLTHPYFASPPPKSTGREAFNLEWIDHVLAQLPFQIAPRDVQASLLEATCQSIDRAIKAYIGDFDNTYVCGGGAFNGRLMARLNELSNQRTLTTQALGIDPQHVEGAAFAWLARQTLHRLPGNCPHATGATKAVILGGIYPA